MAWLLPRRRRPPG